MNEKRLTITIRYDVGGTKEVGTGTMPAHIEDAVVAFVGVLERAGYPCNNVGFDLSYDYHRFSAGYEDFSMEHPESPMSRKVEGLYLIDGKPYVRKHDKVEEA